MSNIPKMGHLPTPVLAFPDATAFHFLLAGGPKVSIVLAATEENSTTTLPTLAMAGLVLFFVPRASRLEKGQLGKLIHWSPKPPIMWFGVAF